MSETFFTSDLHLNHEQIIQYCNRPFKDKNHMNSEIIKRINERVKNPDDTLFIVGDFYFRNSKGGKQGGTENSEYWINQINGRKVFIRGNHDYNNKLKTKIINLTVDLGEFLANVVHDPNFYNPKYLLNICGHVHTEWKSKFINENLLINVGVDVWNFYPVNIREITNLAKKLFKEKENNNG
jgi:calcineurin-like phosphoesterase family protein